MKKSKKIFKLITLIFLIFVICFILAGTCKRKVSALESGFVGYNITISARDSEKYNAVVLYDLGYSNVSGDFLIFENTNYIYLSIDRQNNLNIYSDVNILESIQLGNTRLLECRIVEDLQSLYLIIYKLNFTTQQNQGSEPVIDGISRTMITRYLLPISVSDNWETGDLNIYLMWNNPNYYINYLVNYSYIDTSESVQDINNWVDSQLSNYLTYNNLIHAGYLAGNEAGYLDGFDDGEERGYSDGYSAGESAGYLSGHAEGYEEGANAGYTHGYDEGYHEGYDDGQLGENAISPVLNILSAVFSGVGAIFSIELVPHVPLGVFILVPLFFAVVGLVLWIWRRN